MSDNFELVRAIYAEWERGRYGWVDWAHPEIEYRIADGPDVGEWTGLAGMAEGWRSFLTAWDDARIDSWEGHELDDERVIVIFSRSGRGRASGLRLDETGTRGATLFHIHDGRVTRLVLYHEHRNALADLGVELPPGEVERVRRFLTGAKEAPEEVWDIFADDVEWEIDLLGMPDFTGEMRGPEGVAAFFRRWVGAFDDWGYDVDELSGHGCAVIVRIHQWGRGKGSGVLIDHHFWQVWHMRDGRAVRVTHHQDRDAALADARRGGMPR